MMRKAKSVSNVLKTVMYVLMPTNVTLVYPTFLETLMELVLSLVLMALMKTYSPKELANLVKIAARNVPAQAFANLVKPVSSFTTSIVSTHVMTKLMVILKAENAKSVPKTVKNVVVLTLVTNVTKVSTGKKKTKSVMTNVIPEKSILMEFVHLALILIAKVVLHKELAINVKKTM
jgi:hypothetical protein